LLANFITGVGTVFALFHASQDGANISLLVKGKQLTPF
jgi:hypothetical protein